MLPLVHWMSIFTSPRGCPPKIKQQSGSILDHETLRSGCEAHSLNRLRCLNKVLNTFSCSEILCQASSGRSIQFISGDGSSYVANVTKTELARGACRRRVSVDYPRSRDSDGRSICSTKRWCFKCAFIACQFSYSRPNVQRNGRY